MAGEAKGTDEWILGGDHNTMPTYTFFLEFQGGTYISQIRAKNFREAHQSGSRTWT